MKRKVVPVSSKLVTRMSRQCYSTVRITAKHRCALVELAVQNKKIIGSVQIHRFFWS